MPLPTPNKGKAITPAQQIMDSVQLAASSLTTPQTINGQYGVLTIAMQPLMIVQHVILPPMIDHNSNIQTPQPYIPPNPLCRTQPISCKNFWSIWLWIRAWIRYWSSSYWTKHLTTSWYCNLLWKQDGSFSKLEWHLIYNIRGVYWGLLNSGPFKWAIWCFLFSFSFFRDS
jgi:hypothetical protein